MHFKISRVGNELHVERDFVHDSVLFIRKSLGNRRYDLTCIVNSNSPVGIHLENLTSEEWRGEREILYYDNERLSEWAKNLRYQYENDMYKDC